MELKDLLTELKKLKLPPGQYAIYGSGPMAIRGLRKARDLDVVVTDSLYKKLLKKYKEKKPGQIKIGEVEIYAPGAAIFDSLQEAKKIINRAETIEGFKFVCLDDLLKWKHKMGRAKDFKDVKIIENYLRGKKTMETKNKVEIFIFKKSSNKVILFLLLKRIPEKGGFWQPITGNVGEEESFKMAAQREVKEETGISEGKLIDTGYSFDYFDEGSWWHEKVFGMEVGQKAPILLSREHTEFKWVTQEEALNQYLKWPSNKEGLKKLIEALKKGKEK